MEHLKIEYLPIGKLKPYERNAKKHPQEQIDQIAASIREFGMNDPIGIWGDECLVVEGHGRLLALQQMGEKEVATIRLDHMTDEQRRAYTLAHNQTTLSSGFDFTMLEAEMDDIADIDMGQFGFHMTDEEMSIDHLFEDKEEKPPKEPKQIQCPHCGMWFEA